MKKHIKHTSTCKHKCTFCGKIDYGWDTDTGDGKGAWAFSCIDCVNDPIERILKI